MVFEGSGMDFWGGEWLILERFGQGIGLSWELVDHPQNKAGGIYRERKGDLACLGVNLGAKSGSSIVLQVTWRFFAKNVWEYLPHDLPAKS